MKDIVYLVCTDGDNNHYKYYKMIPLSDTRFKVEYGRVGAKAQVAEYPMSKWDSIYREKTGKKGYEDKSKYYNLKQVDTKTNDKQGYSEIEDDEIRQLVDQLISMNRRIVTSNYAVFSETITQNMIDDAQQHIDNMSNVYAEFNKVVNTGAGGHSELLRLVQEFNNTLTKLIGTVPRKNPNIDKSLINPVLSFDVIKGRMAEIISFEEDLLNNMRTYLSSGTVLNESEIENMSNKTILDALGLLIEKCDDSDWKRIKSCFADRDKRHHLDSRVVTAYKVTNNVTEKRFKAWKTKYKDDFKRFPCKLLWHGSRNENWWSIINQGLRIRPSGAVYTGSMFGDGLYFANSAYKSFGYTSSNSAVYVRGNANTVFMALFDVAVGNQLHTDNNYNGLNRMTWNKLRDRADENGKQYHSVYAHAGRQLQNDELIMYNSNQVTIRYLVVFRG